MKKDHLSILLFLFSLSFEIGFFLDVNCYYDEFNYWSPNMTYRCFVMNVSTPDNTFVTNITGTHMANKSNDDVISFHCWGANLKFFPKGLERIYSNLIGIQITDCGLKVINQADLNKYVKLKYLSLTSNNIEYIGNDIFKFNTKLEVIDLENNKIQQIDTQVFQHLNYLTSLDLSGNPFNKMTADNNSTEVQEVTKKASKLQSLHDEAIVLEMNQTINELRSMLTNSKERTNPWILVMMGIVGFIQTIILILIYKFLFK
ncbi:hypothetical protein ACKWTF_015979 [Chironomus riparius]